MEKSERDQLITDNLPLVGYHVSEILRRVPSHVQREDLAAAGSLALVQAAQAYDPQQGVPFHRYATFRVRGAMLDELRAMDWASRGSRQRTKQLDEMTQTLTAAAGRAPTREELASALGVDVAQVEAAQMDASRRVVSIDGAATSSDDEQQRGIDLVDPDMSPEEHLLTDERTVYLHAAVRALPKRLRYVVEQAFFHERQVSDIAAELGVTQSRVSQLRSEALTLIRDGMNAHLEPAEDNSPQEPPSGVVARRRASYFEQVGQHAQNLTQNGLGTVVSPGAKPSGTTNGGTANSGAANRESRRETGGASAITNTKQNSKTTAENRKTATTQNSAARRAASPASQANVSQTGEVGRRTSAATFASGRNITAGAKTAPRRTGPTVDWGQTANQNTKTTTDKTTGAPNGQTAASAGNKNSPNKDENPQGSTQKDNENAAATPQNTPPILGMNATLLGQRGQGRKPSSPKPPISHWD